MPGMTPRLISGWPELGVVGRDNKVAHHSEFAAATERVAGNGRNDGLAHGGDAVARTGEEVLAEHVDVGLLRHLLDIGAAANAFSDPVTTLTRTLSSRSHASSTSHNSPKSCWLSALSASGRLSVMTPTGPSVSTIRVL